MTFSTLAIKNRLVRLRSQKEDQERRPTVATVEKYWCTGQGRAHTLVRRTIMK